MVPFAGDEYASDETIGLMQERRFSMAICSIKLTEAEALAKSAMSEVRATSEQATCCEHSVPIDESMDKAIALARENARVTSDEIVYLRRRLIVAALLWIAFSLPRRICRSTESQEIIFKTEGMTRCTVRHHDLFEPAFNLH